MLSQGEVLTYGRAQFALNKHHINRTWYANQLSLTSLSLLKQTAYSEYCQKLPQFKFCSAIIELELLVSRVVRSLREGDYMCKHVTTSAAGFTP